MRILCLIDFHPGTHGWLWEHQGEPKDQVDYLIAPLSGLQRFIGKSLAYTIGNGLQAAGAILRILTRQYDLVVAWEGKNGLPFALLKRLLRRKTPKLVILAFTRRGALASRPEVMRYLLEAIDVLVFPCQFDAQACSREFNLPAREMHVCQIGAYDTEYLVVPPEPMNSEASPIRVFSGGYSNRDFAVLKQAACDLPAAFQIAGAPPHGQAADWPPQAGLRWTPGLPPDEYLYQLANADIVVVPLNPGQYSAGLVDLMSAMACGRAVIASDAAGMREYVVDGETGLLVKPGDPGDLQAALRRLIDTPQERKRLGANARQAYLADYSMPAFAGRVFHLLAEAVN